MVGLPAEVRPSDPRSAFGRTLHSARVVGVLRAGSSEDALHAARAAARGGLRVLEVTFTIPGAPALIERLHAEQLGMQLGAGTVMTAVQARDALSAGATFLVGPTLCGEVWSVARTHDVPYVPGVLTPTEIQRALDVGVPVVKLFPAASSGGPAYLKDLLGPFPQLEVLATGGVGPGDTRAYLGAGAVAVGLGSLFPARALLERDMHAVETLTRDALLHAGLS